MRPLVTLILFLTSLTAQAQQFSQTRLDSLCNALNNSRQATGTIAISRNGSMVYNKAFGVNADGEVLYQNSSNMAYRIGSVTKMYTAVMVLQLVQEHKLALNTRLNQYFPQVPKAADMTIDMLLSHTSGIHNYTADADFNTYAQQPANKAKMLARISRFRPDFKPGEKAMPSNTNYLLLGYLVEQLTGQSYAANLKQRITGKLGLQHTQYAGTSAAYNFPAFSLRGSASVPIAQSNLTEHGASGGIQASAGDMAVFIRALFKLKLGNQALLNAMMPASGSLGRGLIQIPVANETGFGYFSVQDGFKCSLIYLPGPDVAVAACFNNANTDDNAVVEQILNITLQQLQHVVNLPAAQLSAYKGVYRSSQLPLKLTISTAGGHLVLQADQREPLVLETISAKTFRFTKGAMQLDFDLAQPKRISGFQLRQGDKTYRFFRER